MAKIVTFLGTRSDIVKLSPVIPLLVRNFDHVLVHSGQHYAREMDGLLFQELGLPDPDVNLRAGSSAGVRQIAHMMLGLEPVLIDRQPGALIVLGGSNTALAGALTGAKLGVHVAHVEAGRRAPGSRAPEEANRVIIDLLSHWLFAPDENARAHLLAERVEARNIHTVGSTTVDACRRNADRAEARPILSHLKVESQRYLVLTLHRAENTEPETLRQIIAAVNALSKMWPIVFPIHPRTQQALRGEKPFAENVKVVPPLGYLDMLHLVRHARALLTDSSGLQEESVVLGTPALVMRSETEWLDPIEIGASALVGNSYRSLMDRAWPILSRDSTLDQMRNKSMRLPGGASYRIAQRLGRDLGVIMPDAPEAGPPARAPLTPPANRAPV